jgi:flagellar biosynthesis/type III secretory pathway M-ring protein FliF/YscJ
MSRPTAEAEIVNEHVPSMLDVLQKNYIYIIIVVVVILVILIAYYWFSYKPLIDERVKGDADKLRKIIDEKKREAAELAIKKYKEFLRKNGTNIGQLPRFDVAAAIGPAKKLVSGNKSTGDKEEDIKKDDEPVADDEEIEREIRANEEAAATAPTASNTTGTPSNA